MTNPPPDPPTGIGDGTFELVAESPQTPADGTSPTCMGCGALLRAGADLCSRCGLDSRTGVRATEGSHGKRAVKKCSACGYDLSGLKRPVCPECGASFSAKDRRRLDREHSEGVARGEWIKPLAMLGFGWTVVLAYAFWTGGASSAGVYLAQYAVTLPVGLLAYLVCCIAGVGFDAPLRLSAWRLAGAFALIDAAILAGGIVPNVYIAWGLPGLVAVAIFEHVFDLDWPEAFACGFVTYAARKVAVLWLTGQLAALF